MKRETGYYWVKIGINTSNWRMAYWHTNYGGIWTWIAGSQDLPQRATEVVEINETRIKNPDEK